MALRTAIHCVALQINRLRQGALQHTSRYSVCFGPSNVDSLIHVFNLDWQRVAFRPSVKAGGGTAHINEVDRLNRLAMMSTSVR